MIIKMSLLLIFSTQQEVPEEHDHEDSDSLQLGDVTPVPSVGSSDGITNSDADIHCYPR